MLTQSLLTKSFSKQVRHLLVLVYSFNFSAPLQPATKRLVINSSLKKKNGLTYMFIEKSLLYLYIKTCFRESDSGEPNE